MPTLRLDIDEAHFTQQLIAMLARGGVDLQYAVTTAVKSGISQNLEQLVAAGICLRYRFKNGGQSRILSLKEAVEHNGFDFWYLDIQIDFLPGTEISERDVSRPLGIQWLAIDYGSGVRKTFKFKRTTLKTRERYEIQILHPQVTEQWPARWVVADDVGLGKTIEAGLILWRLFHLGLVGRLLILCPASLVQQWQERLFTMFDIRVAQYNPAQDSNRVDFWRLNPYVVASFHTLRADREQRHERMLQTDPWDLIIVDEAHHLNFDEAAGMTLAHRLIRKLQDAEQLRSLIFFTGTPHRGKHFGFFALMSLVRPDLFDPRKPVEHQLTLLPQALIRNNKYHVTDLRGQRLFRELRLTT